MESHRPGPGEVLNSGTTTVPRLAATVILARAEDGPLEVLLVQRNPEARFMGGAWVFPGGAVDRHEGEGDAALRAAAVRELHEEAGIRLAGPDRLTPFSRWITPAEVKIRFDTWFYLALSPPGEQPVVDGLEVVDAGGSTRGGKPGRAAARLPDDQAPRAALRVPHRARAHRLRA
jgi:8-oxo-dGTP pyrophosphatase MutT (NUDIX family)